MAPSHAFLERILRNRRQLEEAIPASRQLGKASVQSTQGDWLRYAKRNLP